MTPPLEAAHAALPGSPSIAEIDADDDAIGGTGRAGLRHQRRRGPHDVERADQVHRDDLGNEDCVDRPDHRRRRGSRRVEPGAPFPVEHAQLDLVEERAVEAGGGRGVGTGPSLRHCAGVAALAGIRTGEFAAAREGHADAMLYH
jgi:hypothetical protein